MNNAILGMELEDLCEVAADLESLKSEIRPGDLLFFRNDGPLSKLISHFDGYWSHVGMVIDSDTIAHSTDPGAIRDPITVDSLKKKGPQGGALARVVGLDADAGARAAVWAARTSVSRHEYDADPKNADIKEYEGRDLGLAAALILRSILRRHGWKDVPADERVIAKAIEVAHREALGFQPAGYSCSGFVYAAYAKGAFQRIDPKFDDEILRISDTHVLAPPDPARQALAGRTLGADTTEDFEKLIDASDVLSPFEVQQAFRAFPKVFRALRNNRPLQIDQVVSPGSLWRSRHVEPIMYLTPEAREVAHREAVEAKAGD